MSTTCRTVYLGTTDSGGAREDFTRSNRIDDHGSYESNFRALTFFLLDEPFPIFNRIIRNDLSAAVCDRLTFRMKDKLL